MSIRIYPISARGPYIRELKSNENGSLVYNGYFYYDQKDLPLQRVMIRFGEESVDVSGVSLRSALSVEHIEIYEKISGEDTSEFFKTDVEDDDDEDSLDGVCFFPTEITTLKYRVIKSDLTPLERKMILETIAEMDKEADRKRVNSYIDKAEAAEKESDD